MKKKYYIIMLSMILCGILFGGNHIQVQAAAENTVIGNEAGVGFYYDEEEEEEEEEVKIGGKEKDENTKQKSIYKKANLPQTGEAKSEYFLIAAGVILFVITLKGGREYVFKQNG